MKIRSLWKWSLGVSLAVIPIASCCQAESFVPPVFQATDTEQGGTGAPITEQSGVDLQRNAPEIADALATPVPVEKSVPSNVNLSGAAAEVARLASSGVDEGVLLAYVKNSTSTFNLTAEEIIYFKDIGFPDSVVSGMLEHDQTLKVSEAGIVAPSPTSPPPEQAPIPYTQTAAAPTSANVQPVLAAPPATAYPAFYDSLSPYGTWNYLEGYGYCWQPAVVGYNSDWRPYFDCGHWTYTDCGWYWASDYSWGWGPFHYGRWFNHHRLGWCWAPDNVWGPSWVSWRYSDDYCGWAPLPPSACFQTDFGLTWYGRSAAIGCDFGLSLDCFAFIDWHHFHENRLRDYCVPPREVSRVYNQTVVVNNIIHNHSTIINAGIPAERVFAATHIPVHQVALRDVSRPDSFSRRIDPSGKAIAVYRPHIPVHGATTVAVASRPEALRNPSGFTAATHPPSASFTEASRNTGLQRAVRNGESSASVPKMPDPRPQVQTSSPQRPTASMMPEFAHRTPQLVSSQARYEYAPRQSYVPPTRPVLSETSPSVRDASKTGRSFSQPTGTYLTPLSQQVQRSLQPRLTAGPPAELPRQTAQPAYTPPRYSAPPQQPYAGPMRSFTSVETRIAPEPGKSQSSISTLPRNYSAPMVPRVQTSRQQRPIPGPLAELPRQTAQPSFGQPRYSPSSAASYSAPMRSFAPEGARPAPIPSRPMPSNSAPQRSYSQPQGFGYPGASHYMAAPAIAPSHSYAPPAAHGATPAPTSGGNSVDGGSHHRR